MGRSGGFNPALKAARTAAAASQAASWPITSSRSREAMVAALAVWASLMISKGSPVRRAKARSTSAGSKRAGRSGARAAQSRKRNALPGKLRSRR